MKIARIWADGTGESHYEDIVVAIEMGESGPPGSMTNPARYP